MYCSKCGLSLPTDSSFCPRCGEKCDIKSKTTKISNETNLQNSEKINFYIVPTVRLIIFSILSFGFYSVYWFSLNFSAIEKRRKDRNQKTSPNLWGFFNTLTSEILFKELSLIKKESTGKGFKISPSILGVVYFIFMVLGGYFLLTPFIFIYTALTFQKKVRDYDGYGLTNYNKSKFNWREIIIVFLGLLFFILGLASEMSKLEDSNNVAKNENKSSFSNTINGESFNENTLQEVVDETNKGLPEMVDAETRLDSLDVINRGINYNYTLVNLNKADLATSIFSDKIRKEITSSVCTSPDMSFYLENKAILKYSYYDKNKVFIESIVVDTEIDCD